MDDHQIKRAVQALEYHFPDRDSLEAAYREANLTAIINLRLLQVNIDRSLYLGHVQMAGQFEYIATMMMADHEIRKAYRETEREPTMVYAGIGSRKTPPQIAGHMQKIAGRLEEIGMTLRSGAAKGADAAFESGVKHPDNKAIYLPFPGFNGSNSLLGNVGQDAINLALLLHPSPDALKKNTAALKLMARNGYQILGDNLNEPVDFVCCYTEDGAETASQRTWDTGGTGQAVMLGDLLDIPVYNLKNPDAMMRLTNHVEAIKAHQKKIIDLPVSSQGNSM